MIRRIGEHHAGRGSKFTSKYNCHKLVHYEVFQTIEEAILREKQLKWWRREWKELLIEEKNPKWSDLGETLKGNPLM